MLAGLADGGSYQGVADALQISIHTVRTHVRSSYRKLGVHNVAEAVARALQQQIL